MSDYVKKFYLDDGGHWTYDYAAGQAVAHFTLVGKGVGKKANAQLFNGHLLSASPKLWEGCVVRGDNTPSEMPAMVLFLDRNGTWSGALFKSCDGITIESLREHPTVHAAFGAGYIFLVDRRTGNTTCLKNNPDIFNENLSAPTTNNASMAPESASPKVRYTDIIKMLGETALETTVDVSVRVKAAEVWLQYKGIPDRDAEKAEKDRSAAASNQTLIDAIVALTRKVNEHTDLLAKPTAPQKALLHQFVLFGDGCWVEDLGRGRDATWVRLFTDGSADSYVMSTFANGNRNGWARGIPPSNAYAGRVLIFINDAPDGVQTWTAQVLRPDQQFRVEETACTYETAQKASYIFGVDIAARTAVALKSRDTSLS